MQWLPFVTQKPFCQERVEHPFSLKVGRLFGNGPGQQDSAIRIEKAAAKGTREFLTSTKTKFGI